VHSPHPPLASLQPRILLRSHPHCRLIDFAFTAEDSRFDQRGALAAARPEQCQGVPQEKTRRELTPTTSLSSPQSPYQSKTSPHQSSGDREDTQSEMTRITPCYESRPPFYLVPLRSELGSRADATSSDSINLSHRYLRRRPVFFWRREDAPVR
jgi:hypothetical protein